MDDVLEEKLIVFFNKFSSLRSIKYLLTIDVFPVPAEPINKMGFLEYTCKLNK